MKRPKCRFRGLKVGRRYIENQTTPLHELDDTTMRIAFVAVVQ